MPPSVSESATVVRPETSNRPIGVGLVGYGATFSIGASHIRRIGATPGLKALAICDIDPERRRAAANDHPNIPCYASLDEMLARSTADVVVILTPNSTHAALTMEALHAGKHVVVEKPISVHVEQADELVATAERLGLTLTVHHNRRLDAEFLAIQRAIKKGYIGRPFHYELARTVVEGFPPGWRANQDICGTPLHDWGSHLIDWLLQLCPSPPARVYAYYQTAQPGGEVAPHIDVHVSFVDGRSAVIQMSSASFHPRPMFRVLGDRSALVLRRPGVRSVEIWKTPSGPRPSKLFRIGPNERYRFYRNLVAHLREGVPLLVSPRSARQVVVLLEAADRAARMGCAVNCAPGTFVPDMDAKLERSGSSA